MKIMNRYAKIGAASFAILIFAVSTTARGGWEVTYLHPAGANSSEIWAVSGDRQVGVADGHAALWNGTAASWVDLHPDGYDASMISDISDEQQVGIATIPGFGWGWEYRAGIWSGTAQSWVNLHPVGAYGSWTHGSSGNEQVGTILLGFRNVHASLWKGTAESWVDLHPAGATDSRANAASGGQQVGWARDSGDQAAAARPDTAFGGELLGSADFVRVDVVRGTYAGLWTGSADSWVNLHPAGAIESFAEDASEGCQVGAARFGAHFHAGMWSGTADSWVDLHPAPGTESIAYGIAGNWQVGIADGHAALWNGTSESFLNLHDLLGPEYSESVARSIDVSGDHIWVGGVAYRDDIGQAVLWHYEIPEPASVVLLGCCLPGFSLLRQRRYVP